MPDRAGACRRGGAGCITVVVPYRRARGACAARTFAAVALPDEAPQQVGAVVTVRGLVEGLLDEGVGAGGRGLRHDGRAGRPGGRYSCRAAGRRGLGALVERLARPTIAARLCRRTPAPCRPRPPLPPAARTNLASVHRPIDYKLKAHVNTAQNGRAYNIDLKLYLIGTNVAKCYVLSIII